jgi:hypothetical protein
VGGGRDSPVRSHPLPPPRTPCPLSPLPSRRLGQGTGAPHQAARQAGPAGASALRAPPLRPTGYVAIGFTDKAGRMGPGDSCAGWLDASGTAQAVDLSTRGHSVVMPEAQQDCFAEAGSLVNGVLSVTFHRKLDTQVCVCPVVLPLGSARPPVPRAPSHLVTSHCQTPVHQRPLPHLPHLPLSLPHNPNVIPAPLPTLPCLLLGAGEPCLAWPCASSGLPAPCPCPPSPPCPPCPQDRFDRRIVPGPMNLMWCWADEVPTVQSPAAGDVLVPDHPVGWWGAATLDFFEQVCAYVYVWGEGAAPASFPTAPVPRPLPSSPSSHCYPSTSIALLLCAGTRAGAGVGSGGRGARQPPPPPTPQHTPTHPNTPPPLGPGAAWV